MTSTRPAPEQSRSEKDRRFQTVAELLFGSKDDDRNPVPSTYVAIHRVTLKRKPHVRVCIAWRDGQQTVATAASLLEALEQATYQREPGRRPRGS